MATLVTTRRWKIMCTINELQIHLDHLEKTCQLLNPEMIEWEVLLTIEYNLTKTEIKEINLHLIVIMTVMVGDLTKIGEAQTKTMVHL